MRCTLESFACFSQPSVPHLLHLSVGCTLLTCKYCGWSPFAGDIPTELTQLGNIDLIDLPNTELAGEWVVLSTLQSVLKWVLLRACTFIVGRAAPPLPAWVLTPVPPRHRQGHQSWHCFVFSRSSTYTRPAAPGLLARARACSAMCVTSDTKIMCAGRQGNSTTCVCRWQAKRSSRRS